MSEDDVVMRFEDHLDLPRRLVILGELSLVQGERIECTRLEVRPVPQDRGLSTDDLRSVNLSGIIQENRRVLYESVVTIIESPGVVWPKDLSKRNIARLKRAYRAALPVYEKAATQPRRRTARAHHDLNEVARVYREALHMGYPPRQVVAEDFHLSPSGASKLIRLARDTGALGETEPGKAGEQRKAKLKRRARR